MDTNGLLHKAMNLETLSAEEGLFLYTTVPTPVLMFTADAIRRLLHPDNVVTWIIDRNINTTNVCMSQCLFCNFCRRPGEYGSYIISPEEYYRKIDELFRAGGDQLLLQGGMHPALGLGWYVDLFRDLKQRYPRLKLHALGPPEIVFLSKRERLSYTEVLQKLIDAGLDSLPGAGAEILCDRVRKVVSPAKATVSQWLEVMAAAHRLNLPTTATMMFGHIETPAERIEHLIKLQTLQSQKPDGAYGFLSFIPWPFMDKGTVLREQYDISSRVTTDAYIRLFAVSRILLPGIPNLQPSWLTVGKETAQLCLHAGGNDFGSVMMEENVVSSAGAHVSMNVSQITEAIREAGFTPVRRNQKFERLDKNEG